MILHLLREQASLYGALESLSAQQRRLVAGDDVGPLLALLADRQKLSRRLAGIAGRLAPLRREWSAYRARLAPVHRAEADRLLSEAGKRLQQVIERDEHDARVLSGRKQAVAEALRATHSTGRAIAAYRAPVQARGSVDGVGEDA